MSARSKGEGRKGERPINSRFSIENEDRSDCETRRRDRRDYGNRSDKLEEGKRNESCNHMKKYLGVCS